MTQESADPFDAMHAVNRVMPLACSRGCLHPAGSVRNGTPLEDFGNGHPDLNLTYAHDPELVHECCSMQ